MSYRALQVFPFGKYKRELITDVLLSDPSYILWYLSQSKGSKDQLGNILRFWIDIIDRLPFNKRYRSCYDCGDRPDMVVMYRTGYSEYYQATCEEHQAEVLKTYSDTVVLRRFGDIVNTKYKRSAFHELLRVRGYEAKELMGEDGMTFLLSEDEEAQLFNLSMTKQQSTSTRTKLDSDPRPDSMLTIAEGRGY